MKIAGIDYSMTSPGICVHDMDKPFTFENCKFYFLTDKKYLDGKLLHNVYGKYLNKKDYQTDIGRFDAICQWAIHKMEIYFHSTTSEIALEGYSMGSRGRVFNIGENTGILKHQILYHGWPLTIYSPKEIKMFAVNNTPLDFSAVNKNKIDKYHMYDIFLEETGTDLQQILTPKKKKIDSPVSDIVDSYYICKLLRDDIENGRFENAQDKS